MDSRNLWDIATLAPSRTPSNNNDCGNSDHYQYAYYHWVMTVLFAITYAYQVGLAYNRNSDSTTCRRVMRALLYMPLSIFYSVQYIFAAVLLYRLTSHLLNDNQARSMNVRRERQQQDQIPAIMNAANYIYTIAQPTTNEEIALESVTIQIEEETRA